MTPTDSDTDVRCELLEYLEYQRASVRSIVEGLNEDAWHTPVVASGWTVAGIVEHLGGAERHWFQEVVAGLREDQPWDEGRPPYDPAMAFTCDNKRPARSSRRRRTGSRRISISAILPPEIVKPMTDMGSPSLVTTAPTAPLTRTWWIATAGWLNIAARLATSADPRSSAETSGRAAPPSARSTASGSSTATSASRSPLRAAAKNARTTRR